jgi:hypothetical protein
VGLAKQDLDAIWTPRIGENGVRELRRYRRAGFIGMTLPFVAGAAGLLLGTSTLGDVLGAALAAVVAWRLAAFIYAQMRVAAALSEWFGVKISAGQLPLMNPGRFDAWCERNDLHHGQAEQTDGVPRRRRMLKYDHNWGPIRWSGRGPQKP